MTATIGIRLEDKNHWERRVPLVPDDVARLIQGGLRVVVQSSPTRTFSDDEYRAVGAEVAPNLDDCDVIFAVKEIPMDKLFPGRPHVFFAHVIKGQSYNMPLLRYLLDERITLIDYERIADDAGSRLVFFGGEAGQAGMIDSLHVLGQRLAWEGTENPFSDIQQAYHYEDLEAAKAAVREAGRRLAEGKLELDDGPLVVGFTGRGHVSQGAWDVFDELPHEVVEPEDLERVCEEHAGTSDRIFKVNFQKHHLAQPTEEGKAFDEAEYRAHPELFKGGRLVRYVPYLTVLMHGVYWTDDYPRFLTRKEVSSLWKAGSRKLRVFGDVTCDVNGSINLTYKATSPDDPTYVYDPVKDAFNDGHEGEGVVVLAVDNLPCELPRDSSRHFSAMLVKQVEAIAGADYSQPFDALTLPPALRRAVITHQGELTPDYEYLREYLDE